MMKELLFLLKNDQAEANNKQRFLRCWAQAFEDETDGDGV